MKNPNNSISAVFLYSRTELRLSQRDMARKLRVNQSSICRIENGMINPKKHIVSRLVKLMTRSVSEMLPMAMRLKNTLDEAQKARDSSRTSDEKICYDHLSDSDHAYLIDKWTVLIHEAETKIAKKTCQLKKSGKKALSERAVSQFFDEKLSHQQKLVAYLSQSNAEKGLIASQMQKLSAIRSAQKHSQSQGLTPVEVFLQQMAVEELKVIRDFGLGWLGSVARNGLQK